jgi:Tol biopolymer transport system component
MTPKRWERIKTLYDNALQRDAADRAEFLRQACEGDEDLRRMVEQLLSNLGEAGSFLATVPCAGPNWNVPRREGKPRLLAADQVLADRFRIVRFLGEGGMGEVYEARDLELGAGLALKTIRQEIASEPSILQQFKEEVHRSRQITHPNVCRIYDLNSTRLPSGEDIWFFTMELLAGETLAQRIRRTGALTPGEALPIICQICDGLAAAHRIGIVHRDLKPANVILVPLESGSEYRAVITDFGLAAYYGATASIASLQGNPQIAGTPNYMAPEVLQGKPATPASDVYSLGVVMYEMTTATYPFEGESPFAVVAQRLTEPPIPPRVRLPKYDPRWESVVLRCLARDPKSRFHDSIELCRALESKARDWRPRRVLRPALVALLLATSAAIWSVSRKSASPESTEPRVTPLTSYSGRQLTPAVSPDGKAVAFAWDAHRRGNLDIYLKLVDGGRPIQLTNDAADEYSPAWSPDGRHIAFYRRSAILMIPALGGPVRKLADCSVDQFSAGLSWSPDGNFLAFVDRSDPGGLGIFQVSVATGERTRLTSSAQGADVLPAYSPDGNALAFVRAPAGGAGKIHVLRFAGSGRATQREQAVTSDEHMIYGLDWTPDGQYLIFSSNRSGVIGLWKIPSSGGVAQRLSAFGEKAGRVSVARSGRRLVYTRLAFDKDIWRTPGPASTNRPASPVEWISSTQHDGEPAYSANGNRIVFSSDRSGNFEIWACDKDGQNEVQLTSFGGAPAGSPTWSPDSRWVAFDCPKHGNADIFIVGGDGSQLRRLTSEPSNELRPSWSADGRSIYFSSNRTGTFQIWRAPAAGGAAVMVTRSGGAEESFESADGKYVYFAKRREGVWRVPVRGGEEEQVLGGVQISQWALTRSGIAFFDLQNASGPEIRFHDFATRRNVMVQHFPKQTVIPELDRSIAVSPDVNWILYTAEQQAGSCLMQVDNYR